MVNLSDAGQGIGETLEASVLTTPRLHVLSAPPARPPYPNPLGSGRGAGWSRIAARRGRPSEGPRLPGLDRGPALEHGVPRPPQVVALSQLAEHGFEELLHLAHLGGRRRGDLLAIRRVEPAR